MRHPFKPSPTLVAEPVTCETPIEWSDNAPSIAAALVQPAHAERINAAAWTGGAFSRVLRSSKDARAGSVRRRAIGVAFIPQTVSVVAVGAVD